MAVKLNLFKSDADKILEGLTLISSELRGIRTSLELLALKERSTPLPEGPDEASFEGTSEADYALFEKLARGGPSLPDDTAFPGEGEGAQQAQAERDPVPARARPPVGSFHPRFGE